MDVEIIGIVKKGAKNTRYLAKGRDDRFYTFLAESGLYYPGMQDDISDSCLQANPKQEWINSCIEKSCLHERIIKHLEEYKIHNLRIQDEGLFHGKRYKHILPKEEDNLIYGYGFDSILRNYYSAIKDKNELHIGFANMNSSQAFALNYFCPLIEAGLIGEILGIGDSVTPDECVFEYEDESDLSQFDFFVKKSKLHPSVSVEVKFTEEDFGTASLDKSHLDKYDSNYKENLSLLTKEDISVSEFFSKYQLWRNLLFTLRGQKVCFMFPKFRDDLTESVEKALSKCKNEYKELVSIIYPEDLKFVVPMDYKGNVDSKPIVEYYKEFKNKYLDI